MIPTLHTTEKKRTKKKKDVIPPSKKKREKKKKKKKKTTDKTNCFSFKTLFFYYYIYFFCICIYFFFLWIFFFVLYFFFISMFPYPQFSNRIYVNPKFNGGAQVNQQQLLQQQQQMAQHRQYMEMEAKRMALLQHQQQLLVHKSRAAELDKKRKETAEMMRKRKETKETNGNDDSRVIVMYRREKLIRRKLKRLFYFRLEKNVKQMLIQQNLIVTQNAHWDNRLLVVFQLKVQQLQQLAESIPPPPLHRPLRLETYLIHLLT